MKEDDLHLSCEERKLRAVQYSMNVDTMRRVLRFYEGIEDRNEMTMLENVEEESDESLEEICSSNQLRDPISKCKLSVLGLRFRSSLEKAVQRFLKLRLSEEVKVGFTKSILEKKKPPWAEPEDVEAKE